MQESWIMSFGGVRHHFAEILRKVRYVFGGLKQFKEIFPPKKCDKKNRNFTKKKLKSPKMSFLQNFLFARKARLISVLLMPQPPIGEFYFVLLTQDFRCEKFGEKKSKFQKIQKNMFL